MHKKESLNSSIFIFNIEFMIKNFPRKKTAVPNDFTGKSFQIFKERRESFL